MASVEIEKQFASCEPLGADVPTADQIDRWASAALAGREGSFEMTVRFVGLDEMQALNREYRRRDKPTNVLSFPCRVVQLPGLLGDVVICDEVVRREAAEQHKTAEAHFAHMLIHGTLHLLGYDHQKPADAEEMENAERELLARLGFSDPYEVFDRVQ